MPNPLHHVGVPRDAFSTFAMPGGTNVFDSTFRDAGVVRSDDITKDPRYSQNPSSYRGMPLGHLSVCSYLAVPVVSRSGETLGGLFFGHSQPARFTAREESLVGALAVQASIAMDNARLVEELRRRTQQAEEASRLKDEFLSTASHELRTPLNAILGWTRMLRSGTITPENTPRALEIVERNARMQTQLVEDLLEVSRIITGKLRLEVRPVDLVKVIEAVVDSVRPAMAAKGIRLEATLDPDAAAVSGDPDRLQQVVWNLLSNAVKFTASGGRVETRLAREGDRVTLTVADTGVGIAPEFMPYVFDRFRQADTGYTRKFGGLGLGLAISKQLVEMHGGTIAVESAGHDKGATFRLSLPASAVPRRVATPDSADYAESPPIRFEPDALAGIRVLVVDDEADARDLVRTILVASGAEVDSVASAAEALASLDRQVPDVLLCDIGMPGVSGYDLMRRVRARPAALGGRVPAAALTAYAQVADRTRALQAGFQIHVSKPVDPAELTAAVESLARRKGTASA